MAGENVFGEKYVLLSKIAEGGMAEIFLARQLGLGGFQKELVIKRIRQNLTANQQYVELFLDEARIAANLNHPNIVHIYDIGRAFNTYFIAMEYIRGADLSEICRRALETPEGLPYRHAAEIVGQVSEGLAYAHGFSDKDGQALQIIHRDISPSNVLVTHAGIAKLVDFGIAKAATQLHDDAGLVMGKMGYLAPELFNGAPASIATDLFALGVVLFEITTGQRLFLGPDEVVVHKILKEPIPPPSILREDYPGDLERIVMRLLERRPENRYQDAMELHQDLSDLASEQGWQGGPTTLGRYLVDLLDLDGAVMELDDEDLEVFDEEATAVDGAPESTDPEDDEGELIFASRLPDPFGDEP